jgi:S-formylglutathione hydrolase
MTQFALPRPNRRRLGAAGLVLLLVSLAAASLEARLVEEHFFSPALAGNLLGDAADRAVTVYLPPSYDAEPGRRFPVLYLLHGFKAKNHVWTKPAPGRGFNLQEVADALITQGRIPPLIIVMPDGSNAYGGSFYLNSTVTGNWEDYITRDLVAHIDAAYRTIPQPAARGLAGHSMGGYGAFLLGLRHPDVFGAVYALSPACLVFAEHFLHLQRDSLLAAAALQGRPDFLSLDWRTQVVIAMAAAAAPNPQNPPWFGDLPLRRENGREVLDEAVWQRWLQSDPATLAERQRHQLARLRLAFDMGTEDRLLPQTRQLHALLTRLGVPHCYEEFPGDHVSRLPERLRDRALPFFADFFGQERNKP